MRRLSLITISCSILLTAACTDGPTDYRPCPADGTGGSDCDPTLLPPGGGGSGGGGAGGGEDAGGTGDGGGPAVDGGEEDVGPPPVDGGARRMRPDLRRTGVRQ